jgi:hypothetical protein
MECLDFLEGAVLPDNSLSVPILGARLGILRAGTEGSHVRPRPALAMRRIGKSTHFLVCALHQGDVMQRTDKLLKNV